ncbi:MAG: sigma-54-dependent Fis family transcriptional regulator [Planctomycetes bacterium]|nr:sigma-54-dependent Fis family transcriptional regulator [Planctomycetota bacterium]
MTDDILIVDDEPNMLKTLGKILERKGFPVRTAENGKEAMAAIEDSEPALLLTDLKMPEMSGLELLRAARERAPKLGVIVLTGHGTIETAVEAMRHGAFDYLLKPCNADELLIVIDRALEVRRMIGEVKQLRRQVEKLGGFAGLVGDSSSMKEVFAAISSVAPRRTTVLITGESGTGKELVARAIHRADPARAERAFLAVNCGAFSPHLLESQLFGHRKGAFTGAVTDHEGLFQAASGGTLFLDEVSELSKDLQVKFLRALEEREVTPLGTNKPVKIDVRMLAASNRNLEECVRKGDFREDLYFRINVVTIALPSLRDRLEDVPLLVSHFVQTFADEYGIAPKPVDPEVMRRFLSHSWPGNVRELRNVIERTFALSDEPEIRLEHLPRQFGEMHATVPAIAATGGDATSPPTPTVPAAVAVAPAPNDTSLEALERRHIADVLRQTRGSKSEAAKILKINRKRLYRKIKKYGL